VGRFSSDADLNSKLKLNVDLTVAMPCDSKYICFFVPRVVDPDSVGSLYPDPGGQK
jgi:hypothetical protein